MEPQLKIAVDSKDDLVVQVAQIMGEVYRTLPVRERRYLSRIEQDIRKVLSYHLTLPANAAKLYAYVRLGRHADQKLASLRRQQMLFQRLFCQFLHSNSFQIIGDRLDLKSEECMTQISPRVIEVWFTIWMIQFYPGLSRVLLTPLAQTSVFRNHRHSSKEGISVHSPIYVDSLKKLFG